MHSKKSWGLIIARGWRSHLVESNSYCMNPLFHTLLLKASQKEACFLTSKPEKNGGREVFLKGRAGLEEKPQVYLEYQHLLLFSRTIAPGDSIYIYGSEWNHSESMCSRETKSAWVLDLRNATFRSWIERLELANET